ncbi:alkylated DNA repair protein alkB homolog 8 [Selaginella moellendorffii]|nr:alkylated DNA repair protein alkB homolog 8 [Selaginella moellendorffii]|eukprot:XP_002962605.2 alkylated DNA repair protein alkB homolog 8 [Selaginella moellendorffii]
MEGFARAVGATRHLYVANCLGIALESVKAAFSEFGPVLDACAADSSKARVIVSFEREADAAAARDAWNRQCCGALGERALVIEFAVPRERIKLVEVPVSTSAQELGIPGLSLLTEFISSREEERLLQEVDARPWQALAKRRVQHYGYEFLYNARNVDTSKFLGEFPDFLQPLLEKISSIAELQETSEATFPFDQLTVNEYPRGVGLSPHIDTHSAFQGSIISLSLAGPCVMEFRKYASEGVSPEFERKALFLPQRSLLILSGESRYGWHHYIPHHKFDLVSGQSVPRESRRVSYTFRKVRHGPCRCNFRQYCDSQCHSQSDSGAAEIVESVDQEEADPDDLATPEIEKTFVHKVYNAIAPHFSSTRFAKWPRVAAFLDSLPPSSMVIDAGCGNGKYLGLNDSCFFVGCDVSPQLISICARRGHEVFVADAVNLPFRTGCYDAAISIAVLHHLSTEKRRRKAIVELLRIVSTGGKVLVTVWAAEQEDKGLVKKWTPLDEKCVEGWVGDMDGGGKSKSFPATSSPSLAKIDEAEGEAGMVSAENLEEQQEYFVPWHLPYHRAEIAGSAEAVVSGFARKDDKKSAVVYNRYYHVFVRGELERLVSSIDGAVIVDHFFDKSNWCVVLQKS